MRTLQTRDIFSACRLLSAIGAKEELKELASKAEENKDKKSKFDTGFDFIFGIIEMATAENAEKEVYGFIADIFECDWEAVRDMDPMELFEKLEKVADFGKWKDFFKRVAALMKLK